jgi:hypothetical protein
MTQAEQALSLARGNPRLERMVRKSSNYWHSLAGDAYARATAAHEANNTRDFIWHSRRARRCHNIATTLLIEEESGKRNRMKEATSR